MSSKHNTIYRNTTQSLQNTTQISQNTTQYLRNTTQSFPDYVIQDATIQGINPVDTSYMIPIVYRYIYSYLLTYLAAALKYGIRNPETETESRKRNGIRNQISMIENLRISHCII